MKYIFLNIKKFIQSETMMFVLFIACIVATMVTILFFFGLFQNIKQEELDGSYGESSIQLSLQLDGENAVTLDRVKEYCLGLGSEIHGKCWFLVGGVLAEDIEESTSGKCHLGMEFGIQDGVFTLSPIQEKYWKDEMEDGQYFTAEQIEQGELVCVAWTDEDREKQSDASYWMNKYAPQEDGTYLIDGKSYTCIGHVWFGGYMPKVPVTTVEDDCLVRFIILNFEDVITKAQYQRITEDALATFGDAVEIPPLQMVDLDTMKYYRTALIVCCLMMVLAGLVLTVLFRYILMLRQKRLTIFRLCGLTVRQAKRQYIVECILLTAAGSLAGVLLYYFGMLPRLAGLYSYIKDYYAWYTYLILFVLYMVLVSVMQYRMIKRNTEDEIVTVLRGNAG